MLAISFHTCQPSLFRRDCTDFDFYVPLSSFTNPLSRFYRPSGRFWAGRPASRCKISRFTALLSRFQSRFIAYVHNWVTYARSRSKVCRSRPQLANQISAILCSQREQILPLSRLDVKIFWGYCPSYKFTNFKVDSYELIQVICLAAEDVNTRNNQSVAFWSPSYIGCSAGNRAVSLLQKPVRSRGIIRPSVVLLRHYVYETLWRSSILC